MNCSAEEIRARAAVLRARLASCDLCPRRCGVNRLRGERGFFGVAAHAPVAAAVPHFGEEPPVSGTRGAGTIFFGGCSLRCAYCQNHQISRCDIVMPEVTPAQLADHIRDLERQGCHNIEFVTPTHVVPQILDALAIVAVDGLSLPIVFNSGGYEAVDVLRELGGIVDVYLPDLKYADSQTAATLSNAEDYWERATAAVSEMVRQVGRLEKDANGVARRGVIVRHLVLPNDLAGSGRVLSFLAGLVPRPALSLMAQFYPAADCRHPLLQRPVSPAEYDRVRALVEQLGFEDGWIQDLESERSYRPDFERSHPFG